MTEIWLDYVAQAFVSFNFLLILAKNWSFAPNFASSYKVLSPCDVQLVHSYPMNHLVCLIDIAPKNLESQLKIKPFKL